ncbi:hypothetical protein JCM8115_000599 [Rhodotorula mucilaginosa]|uniref:Probable RNA polymerase II nuclear localization protein SLC7A6OS n=1 Tax=Rhodotorula mucilaginosa TaxID=5537 RepID=A0A9P7B8R7_RHOMI|nr:hypothetical protein C6P46_003590 [Rhodotorula mucilaginosa]TKA54493.1 hypothetical protein B0A53_03186 [Rhodotorula sp. CCFEE 5036]
MASSTGEAPPQLSILRIKRKRTQQPTPLDALVIEQLEQPRSKRRKPSSAAPAATEPSDSNRGVFKFAETVPLDSFSTPTKTRSLRDRIQSFLAHPPPGLARSASSSSLRSASLAAAANASASSSPARRTFASSSHDNALRRPATPPAAASTTDVGIAASPTASPSATASPSRRKLPSALRAARAAAISAASSASTSLEDLHAASPTAVPTIPGSSAAASGPSPRLTAIHAEKSRLRYRVVEQRRAFFSAQAEAAELARRERAREDDEIRRGLRPPRVVDSRTLAANSNSKGVSPGRRDEAGLKIYEAVAEGGPATTEVNGPARRPSVARITDAGQNAAMDQFGALLDEYLTLQDHATPSHQAELRLAPPSSRLRDFPPPSSSSSAPRPPSPGHSSEEGEEEEDDADYVYDVYYRATDLAQKGTSSSSASAVTGAAVAGSAASGWDVSSLAGLDRIGQLAGLTEDSDDEAQLLMNEAAAGGSSEEEDNADQDSNEENDYRNDYPDEDEPDSDNNRQEFRDRQADWSEDDSDDGESGGSMQYDSDGDY